MDRLPDDELISAYLDDELSAEERAYVERLLVEKPEARRLLDELRGVRESLQTLPSYRLEPDFNAAVLHRAEREMLRAPAGAAAIEPRRDVHTSSSTPPADGPRWRRPLMWSIVAVAAAVALMIVEQRAGRDQHLAVNRPAESTAKPKAAPEEAAGRVDRATVQKLGDRDEKQVAVTATTAPPATPVADLPRTEGLALKGSAPAEAAPAMKAAAMGREPQSGQFNITGNVVPQSPAAGNLYRVDNSQLGGFAGAAGGGGALGGANVLNPNVAGVPMPSQQLSTAPSLNAYVDTTPIVAFNDFERAKSLVADLQQGETSEQDAVRALATRDPLRRLNERRALVRRQLPANDHLLIVTCDVRPEALERGFAPVLQQQQIADLTQLRLQNANGQQTEVTLQAAAPAKPAAGESKGNQDLQEEYVYMVANDRQVEATLDALRRQPEYFFNVSVEPAPAKPRQQAWNEYSRGVNLAETAKPAGAAVPSSVPTSGAGASAAQPTTPAAALPSSSSSPAAAKPAPTSEPESLAGKNAAGGDKYGLETRNAGLGAQFRARPSDPQGGGAQQTQQATTMNGSYGSYGQGLTPLSRVQRLSPADADDAVANLEAVADQRAGEKTQAVQVPAMSKSAVASSAPAAPAAPGPAAAPAPAAAPQPPSTTQAKTKDDGAPQGPLVKQGDELKIEQLRIAGEAAAFDAFQAAQAYELPPDYHEALFIFRVVSTAEKAEAAGTSPAAATAIPADAAKPAAPASPPRNKSE